MLETTNVSLLQSQYLCAIERANLDSDTNGAYTREGCVQLNEAIRIQLRLAELTEGEIARRHRQRAAELTQVVYDSMLRLGMIQKPEEKPQEKPRSAAAQKAAKPRKPRDKADEPKAEDDELPGFDIADYIVRPGDVHIEEAADAAPEVVTALKNAVYDNFPQLFPNLRCETKNMVHHRLLYGPPGSGKTFLCKGLATYLNEIYPNTQESPNNSVFILLPSSEVKSRFVGTAEHRIRAVFQAATAYRFSVICIDEVDELCPSRSDDSKKTNYTTTLLELIDGVAGKTDSVILLATNHPENVDSALISRVGHSTYIDYPRAPALENFLRSRDDLYPFLADTPEGREDMVKRLAQKAQERHFSFRNMNVLATNIIQKLRAKLLTEHPNGSSEITAYIPLTPDELMQIVTHMSIDFNPGEYAALCEYRRQHGG